MSYNKFNPSHSKIIVTLSQSGFRFLTNLHQKTMMNRLKYNVSQTHKGHPNLSLVPCSLFSKTQKLSTSQVGKLLYLMTITLGWAILTTGCYRNGENTSTDISSPPQSNNNNNSQLEVDCNKPPISVSSSPSPKLDTIDIKIDGTLSMQGYVAVGNSRYIKTLEYLDKAASTSNVSPEKVKYYKFGIKPLPITGSHLQAQQVNFYNSGGANFEYNLIDAAIDPQPMSDKLSIVVTDLYQKDTDIKAVPNRLIPYFDKNMATGILAIRSEFNGKICDTNFGNGGCFPYKNSSKEESFRPVYLIIVGHYDNVKNYFEKLKSLDANLFKDDQFILFSPQLVSQPLFLSIDPRASTGTEGLNRRQPIWVDGSQGRKQIQPEESPKTDLLEIVDRQAGNTIQLTNQQAVYSPLAYTLPIKKELVEQAFQPEVEVSIFDRSSDQFSTQGTQKLKETIYIKNLRLESNQIKFDTEIINDKLESGTYLIRINLKPNPNANNFSFPGNTQWWSKWNTEAGKTDGSKTLNLNNFLVRLQGTTLETMKSNNQVIGRFC
jgi:hypothetical protein